MRNMFAALSLLLLAALAATPASAGAQLTEYGMFSGDQGACKAPGPIMWCFTSNVRPVNRTSDIPGALGVMFGIAYKLDSGRTPIRTTVIFPPAGLHNPRFPRAVPSFSNDEICNGGCIDSYSFDFPWEIVPGIWTFQVWADGHVILEKKFRVYLPDKKKGKPGKGAPTASLAGPRILTF